MLTKLAFFQKAFRRTLALLQNDSDRFAFLFHRVKVKWLSAVLAFSLMKFTY